MRALICALALVLAACADNPSSPPQQQPDIQHLIADAPPAQPVLQVCLPLITVTPEQQKQLRKEFDALAPKSLLRTLVFPDWVTMRDEDRACIKTQQTADHS